jgi:hypothetical protein
MDKCQYKHTAYQIPDEDWLCPKCGADVDHGFYIYESVGDMDKVGFDCILLHDEDYISCSNCGYETNGKSFSKLKMKEKNKIVCPCCKGNGWVDGEKT